MLALCRNFNLSKSAVIKSALRLSTSSVRSATVSKESTCPINGNATAKEAKSKPFVAPTSDVEYDKAKPFSEIPGPKALPLISVIHHFIPGGKYYNMSLKEVHQKMRSEFGEIVWLPGYTKGMPGILFSFDPVDTEKVFRSEGQWPYRRPLEIFQEFRTKVRPNIFQGIGGLIQDQGPEWQDTRTKVNPVMMQPKIVKQYIPPVEEIADEFIARIKRIRDQNNEVPADFVNETNKWTLESIAYIALEQRLHILSDTNTNMDGQRMIDSLKVFFDLSFELEMLPSAWKFYKTKKYKQIMEALNTVTDMVIKLINKSIAEIETKPLQTDHEESVLQKLLKIDKRVAIVMTMDMLLAGVDTTSSATLNLMYHLAKNPEKQSILREEIISKLPDKDSKLSQSIMANMPYLRACMKEAARLQPVALGTARRTLTPLVLGGYQVPAGTDVLMSQLANSSDDRHFKRNTEFLPERFLKDPAYADLKAQHPFVFLPFGFGSRMCVGKRFAELEIEVFISKLLRNSKIEWHYPDMKYKSTLLNMPTGDTKFRIIDIN